MKTFDLRQKSVTEIFNDLDAYRAWCVEFGYVFDERDLYRQKSRWGLYQRSRNGDKTVKNQWKRDAGFYGTKR